MAIAKNTIPRELENRDFLSPLGRISFDLSDHAGGLKLRVDILRCESTFHHQTSRFSHTAPPFCRLFIFSHSGGKIIMDGDETECMPGKIYLLCDEHPFESTYYRGSELLYAHVSVCDQTLRSIFSESKGLRCLDAPELAALLLDVKRRGASLETQCAISAIFGRFIDADMERLRERYLLFDHFRPILELLERIPPAQLRVEELAEAMKITASALSKSFRRRTGMTVKEYLTGIYLRRAGELLLYSSLTTAEIAVRLGHSDSHYFYFMFKRITGCTPTEYRSSHAASSR